jgi:hypothetical protein
MTHEHAQTLRLEARALEGRADKFVGHGTPDRDASLAALLAIAKRLELLEHAIRESTSHEPTRV